MTQPLAHRVRSGVRLTLVSTLASGAIQMVTMVVLARLLGPPDYGFFVVALSINALSLHFTASAVERAMVIEPDASTLSGRAVPLFLLLLIMGAAVLLIVAGIRAVTGWDVQLGVLAIVLASGAIGGLAVVPRALLRRELRFAPIIASELSGLLLGNLLTAASLAWLGFGPFALAIAVLVNALVIVVWMLALAPRDTLRPSICPLGDLRATIFGVIKPATLEAVNGQISPLVVSSVLGAASLGLFNRIYNVVTLPVQLLIASVNRVLISMLVKVGEDPTHQRQTAERVIRAASALIAPLALGLAGSSHTFVAVVLGDKWAAAAQIVPFLAVAVWGNMTGSVLGQLAEAALRFNEKARIQAVSTTLLVLLLLGGSPWDLVGVSIGYMIAAMIFAGLYIRLSATVLDLPIRRVVVWMLPGTVAGVACFAASTGIAETLEGWPPAIILPTQIAACGTAALVSLLALDRSVVSGLLSLFLPGMAARMPR